MITVWSGQDINNFFLFLSRILLVLLIVVCLSLGGIYFCCCGSDFWFKLEIFVLNYSFRFLLASGTQTTYILFTQRARIFSTLNFHCRKSCKSLKDDHWGDVASKHQVLRVGFLNIQTFPNYLMYHKNDSVIQLVNNNHINCLGLAKNEPILAIGQHIPTTTRMSKGVNRDNCDSCGVHTKILK